MIERIVLAGLLASVLTPLGGSAHRKTEQGNRSYVEGQYPEALRSYTEAQVDAPEAPELYYDIGNVLYRQGDYEGAAEAYTRALLAAPPRLVPQAAYNLGNARFHQQDFGEAAKAYQRALRESPSDVDAKRNLELALRALEQQQRQSQSGDGQDEDKNKQQESKQQQRQPQQQGSKPDENDPAKSPGEKDPAQGASGGAEPDPDRMTPDQAARLLDDLDDQERDNLRRELLRTQAAPAKAAERDW